MSRKLKRRLILFGSIFLLIILLLSIAPPIAKQYIVKNSKDLLGRKIDLSALRINYFRVSVTLKDFVMYEQNDKDTFSGFEKVYVNFQPWRLLKKEYSFKEVEIVKPYAGIIIKNGVLNFQDFMEGDTTSAEEEEDTTATDVFRYKIRNFSLKAGSFSYHDKDKNSLTELDDLNLDVPHIAWDSQQSEAGINFEVGEKGKVLIDADIDQESDRYEIDLQTASLDLSPYKGYIKDYLAINDFKSLLSTQLQILGKLSKPENIIVAGDIQLSDLAVHDKSDMPVLIAKTMNANIKEINLAEEQYDISEFSVDGLHLYASVDENSTNIDRLLEPLMGEEDPEDTLVMASSSENDSISIESSLYYNLSKISISNGKISFKDNTLNRPFSYDIMDITINVKGLNELQDSIPVSFSMNMNNMGQIDGESSFSLRNTSQLSLTTAIRNLDLHSFSPYTEYYLASPLTKGYMNYDIKLEMDRTSLKNDNKINISELEFGKKTQDEAQLKIPVKLALYIIKDKNDNIEIDLPVSGDPSSPDFKYGKLIWKTFSRFIVKTAASPFMQLGKIIGTNPEALEFIAFNNLQDTLMPEQMEVLDKLALVHKRKPEFIYSFSQTSDFEKEKRGIALQKAYISYMQVNGRGVEDIKWSFMDDSLKIKSDNDFISWMQRRLNTSDSNIYILANKIAGLEYIERSFRQLMEARENSLKNYLSRIGLKPEDYQLGISDLRNIAVENRRTGFIVEVMLK
jgi:uncharacterized protein involved in outer membrane biogenesis